MVWESKSEGTSIKVMTFPTDFGIVQKDKVPVQMQEFSFEDTEIFAYAPRYTDCHALETYLFGVNAGKAFPISFEIKPNDIRAIIYKLPHHDLQVANGEFIVTGGYAAGLDFIDPIRAQTHPLNAIGLHTLDRYDDGM
jgi:hypothetical protein